MTGDIGDHPQLRSFDRHLDRVAVCEALRILDNLTTHDFALGRDRPARLLLADLAGIPRADYLAGTYTYDVRRTT